MSGRGRVLTLVAVATLSLAGCGGSSDDSAPVADTPAVATASAAPSAGSGKAKPTASTAAAVPAPEVASAEGSPGVTGISAADAAKTKSALEQAEADSAVAWEAPTLKAIDPRLVADRAVAVKRVRTSCAEINGLFSEKAIKLLEKIWSDKSITVGEEMGGAIYDVLIYEACPKI